MRLLDSYSPSKDEERSHAKMVVLAQESGDVLSRYHFRPGHFTASAFVVSDDRDQLLLIHHDRLGKWLQPGGHIEPGDRDIEAAVRREITEETGLTKLTLSGTGLFDADVHDIPAFRGEPRHEHHDLRFLFTASGDPAAGDGVSEAAWVPLDELRTVTTDRSVLRAASKLKAEQSGAWKRGVADAVRFLKGRPELSTCLHWPHSGRCPTACRS